MCLCICYTHVTIVNLPERLCLPNYACFYVVSLCKVGSILPCFYFSNKPSYKMQLSFKEFFNVYLFSSTLKDRATEREKGRGRERNFPFPDSPLSQGWARPTPQPGTPRRCPPWGAGLELFNVLAVSQNK